MNLEGIIFDCDGVLVDSELLSAEVWSEMLADRGFESSVEELCRIMMGGSIGKSVNYVSQFIKDIDASILEKEYRDRSAIKFTNDLQAVQGIEKVLNLSVSKCVASNGPYDKILDKLAITKLDKYFDQSLIFSAHDLNQFKPDPALFLHALSKMDVPKSACVVIEDSEPGIIAALTAGIPVLHYDIHQSLKGKYNVPTFTDMADIYVYLYDIIN